MPTIIAVGLLRATSVAVGILIVVAFVFLGGADKAYALFTYTAKLGCGTKTASSTVTWYLTFPHGGQSIANTIKCTSSNPIKTGSITTQVKATDWHIKKWTAVPKLGLPYTCPNYGGTTFGGTYFCNGNSYKPPP